MRCKKITADPAQPQPNEQNTPTENPSPDHLKRSIRSHGVGYVFPILMTMLLSATLTLPLILTSYFVEVLPFNEGQFQGDPITPALLNAIYFIVIAVAAGFFFVFLIRRNRHLFIKIIFTGAMWFSSTILLLLIIDSIGGLLFLPSTAPVVFSIIGIAVLLGSIFTYSIIHYPSGNRIRNFSIILFGALIGSFLGLNVPTWTVVAVLLALSVWDIYGVFRGPIKEIAESSLGPPGTVPSETKPKELIPLLTYASTHWEIGIGDLAFYSMFTSHVFAVFGIPLFVLIAFAIILGALGTLKLLEKRPLLPGLPLSIVAGVLTLLAYIGITLLVPIV